MTVMILVGGWSVLTQAQSIQLIEYCNVRYGFCVEIPEIFGKGPEPANGDGRVFFDGEAFFLKISAIRNIPEESLWEELRRQEKDFDRVTYRRVKKRWFVLSGYRDDEVLYRKTYVGRDFIYHLFIRYPISKNGQYGDLVSQIVGSFRPGPLEE
jgi:hypothetical protein